MAALNFQVIVDIWSANIYEAAISFLILGSFEGDTPCAFRKCCASILGVSSSLYILTGALRLPEVGSEWIYALTT